MIMMNNEIGPIALGQGNVLTIKLNENVNRLQQHYVVGGGVFVRVFVRMKGEVKYLV